jgi:hypothetical protein
MKKVDTKNDRKVQTDREEQKPEKIWFVVVAQIRRHSRILYLPLDPQIVRMHRLKKGDVVKFQLITVTRAPAEDEPLIEDQGDL